MTIPKLPLSGSTVIDLTLARAGAGEAIAWEDLREINPRLV